MANQEWEDATSGDALDLLAKGDEGTRADAALADERAHGSSLARELERWQAEQERRFNRAWRRPGGLARPSGL
jgi:hypothetical protein